MTRDIKSLDELRAVAEAFLQRLADSPRADHATVVTLSGDLGAGKTAFTKECAALLGSTETITSPTFVLEKRYPIARGAFTTLVHIDAYRLSSAQEMKALAWGEVLADPSNLVFLEWPEHVRDAIPEYAEALSFEYVDEGTRRVSGARIA